MCSGVLAVQWGGNTELKQLVAGILMAFALFGIVACGESARDVQTSEEAQQSTVVSETAPEPASDGSDGQAQQPEQQPEEFDSGDSIWRVPLYAADFSDTLMVGDSVLHLVSGAIYDSMPAATIDASSGRTMEEGGPNEGESSDRGILDILRADGGNGYARYVIGAPANEGGGMSYETGEEIVGILHGKPVWFITQMVTNNSTSTANTNNTIDILCENYPNVHKIDWYQACVEHPEYLVDNAHASDEGAYVYANLIYTALTK